MLVYIYMSSSVCNHTASFAASLADMYSASIDDSATVGCSLHFHEIV